MTLAMTILHDVIVKAILFSLSREISERNAGLYRGCDPHWNLNLGCTGFDVLSKILCVEPEPSRYETFTSYLTGTPIPNVCLNGIDIVWYAGTDMVWRIVSLTFTLTLITVTPRIFNVVFKPVSNAVYWVSKFINLTKSRVKECPHCKCSPCVLTTPCDWFPRQPRKTEANNISDRAKMMKLFNVGLRMRLKNGQCRKDEHFWHRNYLKEFGEEHLVLFPQCIQNWLNRWFPVISQE